MNNKVVLGFGIGRGKEKLIRKCCIKNGADYRSMVLSDEQKTLGSLVGIAGIPQKTDTASEGEMIQSEMLVFSGFDSEAMDQFLEQYRDMGIEKIDAKAMVTMYNIFWTPRMLYQELKKEQESMHQ